MMAAVLVGSVDISVQDSINTTETKCANPLVVVSSRRNIMVRFLLQKALIYRYRNIYTHIISYWTFSSTVVRFEWLRDPHQKSLLHFM